MGQCWIGSFLPCGMFCEQALKQTSLCWGRVRVFVVGQCWLCLGSLMASGALRAQ